MEQQVTIEEVLKATADILKGIQIPVEMSEQIGVPVLRAIRNLNVCVDAIEASNKPEEEKDGRETDAE